jgi:oligopeptide/dipeptide ABC transporter ATP-binding protein
MLLEVENLQMRIRLRTTTVRAVDDVSLTLSAGETLGLVGESGCGKSMTAMSIMRLLPPGGEITGGSVRLNGRDLLALPGSQIRQVRGDEIAMVFQDPMTSLNPTKTVGDQIAEPLQIHRHQSRSDALRRVVELLGLVGMPKPAERLKDYPHQLSGGLRQRAMIAMALACEPKLLIADEPTTALDVTIQDQILTLLGRLTAELGMGLLLITHDMGVIASRADRVMVMYAGRIVESGATGTLFHGARHPYSRALLASIPDLKTDKTKALASIPGLPPDLAHPPPACRFAPRCTYVQPRCEQEEPPLGGEDPEHQFACFFPVQATAGPGRAVPAARRGPLGAAVSATPGSVDGENRDALLVVQHAVKEFPVTKGVLQRKTASVKAVSDVSVAVSGGETFGLVGESGCGKTTLGRLIVGLERPDSGTISFDGEDLFRLRSASLRRRRQHFQLMFQDPYSSLDPRMRVGSILREPLIAQDVGTRKDRERRIRDLLGEVGLGAGAADLYPHEFSGGQRQRIGLARALILEPKLIVADEPVSALDVSIQAQILNLMKRLQSERDLAYVLISHDLSVVRYLADRIGVMYLGKLVETGTAAEVYERPAHPYTAGLLRSVPEPDPAKARQDGEAAISGELPSSVTPPSGCRFRTRCPRAQEICAEQEPTMRAFHAASHQAACHFPLQAPMIDAGPAGAASAPASMTVRREPPP